jgi:general secretion pathway protein G
MKPLASRGPPMARRTAFSLIELVIVVVIIGIIAAIAVPRFSRGAQGAAETALADNLGTLNKAIELYGTEHGGVYPPVANVVNALTMYSDDSGDVAASSGGGHIYGPYLRTIPPMPMGPERGLNNVAGAPAAGVAWVYDPVSGEFTANTAS